MLMRAAVRGSPLPVSDEHKLERFCHSGSIRNNSSDRSNPVGAITSNDRKILGELVSFAFVSGHSTQTGTWMRQSWSDDGAGTEAVDGADGCT